MIVDAAEKTPLPILPEVPDLVWGSVSFVIVALVIFKLAWPTFTRTLDERTRKIDEGLNAAARARDEVAQERAALSDEIDQAHREAAQIREKAQANAVAIVDEAKKAAGVEASRVTEAAQRQIAADTQIAKAQLRRDVSREQIGFDIYAAPDFVGSEERIFERERDDRKANGAALRSAL